MFGKELTSCKQPIFPTKVVRCLQPNTMSSFTLEDVLSPQHKHLEVLVSVLWPPVYLARSSETLTARRP